MALWGNNTQHQAEPRALNEPHPDLLLSVRSKWGEGIRGNSWSQIPHPMHQLPASEAVGWGQGKWPCRCPASPCTVAEPRSRAALLDNG